MGHTTIGDWASLATLGLFLVAFLGFIIKAWDDKKAKVESEAVTAALTDQRNRELATKHEALEKVVDGLAQQTVSLRLDLADFKGENRAQHEANKAALESLDRSVRGLQAQMKFVASGANDKTIIIGEKDHG